MDEQPSPSTGFTSESTSREEDSAHHDRYAGAFFPKAREFVIAGGSFTSITNITRPEPIVPPDFRMISLGDLDLRREIRLESPSGTAHRRSGVVSARRVYSARLHGCNSNMTVVVYQGRNSEEVGSLSLQ
ncbi:hypothetical protein B0H19DRAFT_1192443 [Mycena capillaripes]|nr:hypothetical protein B0H19DRAFT_1192443 [Mycena capillaripes]